MSVIDKRYKKNGATVAYVSWDSAKSKWLSRVRVGQEVFHIGRFVKESLAEQQAKRFIQRGGWR